MISSNRLGIQHTAGATSTLNWKSYCELPTPVELFVAARADLDVDYEGSPLTDRAIAASAEVRCKVAELVDLSQWRNCVLAVYAVCYGHLDEPYCGRTGLFSQVYEAETKADAYSIAEHYFNLDELPYQLNRVFQCLQATLLDDRLEVRTEKITELACLFGLLADASEYAYEPVSQVNMPQEPVQLRYCKTSSGSNVLEILARGDAYFEGSMSELLRFWASLANQQGDSVEPPSGFGSVQETLNWAQALLEAAKDEEGSNAPCATARLERRDQLCLSWRGTWTEKRRVEIVLDFSAKVASLSWDTGTTRPSRFLCIERFLCLPDNLGFGKS